MENETTMNYKATALYAALHALIAAAGFENTLNRHAEVHSALIEDHADDVEGCNTLGAFTMQMVNEVGEDVDSLNQTLIAVQNLEQAYQARPSIYNGSLEDTVVGRSLHGVLDALTGDARAICSFTYCSLVDIEGTAKTVGDLLTMTNDALRAQYDEAVQAQAFAQALYEMSTLLGGDLPCVEPMAEGNVHVRITIEGSEEALARLADVTNALSAALTKSPAGEGEAAGRDFSRVREAIQDVEEFPNDVIKLRTFFGIFPNSGEEIGYEWYSPSDPLTSYVTLKMPGTPTGQAAFSVPMDLRAEALDFWGVGHSAPTAA